MCAVAEWWLAGPLAAAKGLQFVLCCFPDHRLHVGFAVRTVAERLVLRLGACTPGVDFTGLDLDEMRFLLRNDCFIHSDLPYTMWLFQRAVGSGCLS